MSCCNQNSEPNDQCFKINQTSQNNDSSWRDENICVTASLIGLLSEKLRSHFNRPIGIDLNKFFFCNIKNLPYLNTNYPSLGNAPYQIQLWLSNIYASSVLLGNSYKLDFPLLCNTNCEPQVFNRCLNFDDSCCDNDHCSLQLDLSPILAQSNTANSRTLRNVMDILDKYGSIQISVSVTPHLQNFYSIYSTTSYNDDPIYFIDKRSMFLNYDSDSSFSGHILVLLGYECGSGYVDFIVQDSFANNYVSFENSNYKWRIRVLCDTYGDLAPFTLGVNYGNNNIVSFKINNLDSINSQLEYCCDNIPLPTIPNVPDPNKCKDKNNRAGMFMSRGHNAIPQFLGCDDKQKPQPNILVDPSKSNEPVVDNRHVDPEPYPSEIPPPPSNAPPKTFLCPALSECPDKDGRKGLKLAIDDSGVLCKCIWPCGEEYVPYYCDRPDGDYSVGCEKCALGAQYLSPCDSNGFRHCCTLGYFWKESENRCVQCNEENAPGGCEWERVNFLRNCQCCQTGYKFGSYEGAFGEPQIGCYCESVYDPYNDTYFPGEECVSPRTMDLDTCRCECPSDQVWYNNTCIPISERCPEYDSEGNVIGPLDTEGNPLYTRWDPVDLECQCEKGNIDVNDCTGYNKLLNINTCECDCPTNSSRLVLIGFDNFDDLTCVCDEGTVIAYSQFTTGIGYDLPCATCQQMHGQFSYFVSGDGEIGGYLNRERGYCQCMDGYRYEKIALAEDEYRTRCVLCNVYDSNSVWNNETKECDCAPGFMKVADDLFGYKDWTCLPAPSPSPSVEPSIEPSETPSPSDPTPSPSDPTPSPSDPTPSPSDPTPSPSDPTPSPSDPTPSPS